MARLEFALDLAVSFLFAFMHDLKSTFVPSNATHPNFMAPACSAIFSTKEQRRHEGPFETCARYAEAISRID